ncbi:hypothetical protein MMC30_004199 [Trapelia coarctata]|nr:hypothetical protein [Trapelia coarctata]
MYLSLHPLVRLIVHAAWKRDGTWTIKRQLDSTTDRLILLSKPLAHDASDIDKGFQLNFETWPPKPSSSGATKVFAFQLPAACINPGRARESCLLLIQCSENITRSETDVLKRSFGPFNIIAAAFNICQAWAAIGATFALDIAHGGSDLIIYGLVLITLVYSVIALSMTELTARYPTTGGQYHWTFLIAPENIKRELSYLCGSINTIGWITLTASVLIIPPQLVVGLIQFFNSSYVILPWHVFLIYQLLGVMSLLYNILALQRAPWTHDIGFFLSVGSFVATTITCLVIADPKESSKVVWTDFTNQTGWTVPGIAFLTGLINLNYGFAGLDGAIHLTDECLNAATAVPWALVSAIFASFVTAMVFMIATLYCVNDFDAVLNTPTGVLLYEIRRQATKSSAVATTFIALLGLILIFTLLAAQQTSSRLIWSFARDDALIFSKYLKRLDPRLSVPVWALLFNWVWVFILGCVHLASSTAFNAIATQDWSKEVHEMVDPSLRILLSFTLLKATKSMMKLLVVNTTDSPGKKKKEPIPAESLLLLEYLASVLMAEDSVRTSLLSALELQTSEVLLQLKADIAAANDGGSHCAISCNMLW